MKIVVHNRVGEFALSRKQVQTLHDALNFPQWALIREFHLCYPHAPWPEMFFFDRTLSIVYFSSLPGIKTPQKLEHVVTELLVGLSRMNDATTNFNHPLKAKERAEHDEFVATYLPKALATLQGCAMDVSA
ncbi:MAG: hypothetical protein ACRCWJ_13655 [Casimicrobium sp.]